MDAVLMFIFDLAETLHEIPPVFLYAFFTFSTLIENIFPPWPSDTLIVFSGFLASGGSLSLTGAFLSSWAGNVAGGMVMYYFGNKIFHKTRKLQKKIHASEGFLKKVFSFASHDSLMKTRRLFDSYGFKFVLFSRFFPGVRFFVSIVAGVHSMNLWLYLLSFAAGSFFWGLILVYAGFLMGTQWENAIRWLKVYNIFAVSLTAAAVLAYIVYANRHRFARKNKE